MCGVIGYAGPETDLGATLVRGLQTLEYRGYDSWGIAYAAGDRLAVRKQTGRISAANAEPALSDLGFGHTRWATHGGVTEANAHPHLDASGRIAVVHNGIIENHVALRAELRARGTLFRSETDSEVVAHLVAERIAAGDSLTVAVAAVFQRLQGLNAIVALDLVTRELAATKHVSPLVAAHPASGGGFVASDALALRPHTDRVVYLEDHHLLSVSANSFTLYDRESMQPETPRFVELSDDEQSARLGEFPHFMAKEIAEQPATLVRLAHEGESQIRALAEAMQAASTIYFTGCGTAVHAAMTGQHLLATIARTRVQTVVASEFASIKPFLDESSLVIALSQSGETVDVIEAMMTARDRGAKLAALVNVQHSTLDRMVDQRIHLLAGPEQCVLATKSYTAMVAALMLTAHQIAGSSKTAVATAEDAARAMSGLLEPANIARIAAIAESVKSAEHLFVIGRGQSHASALEAALKIKEVSYIHAEGFAAGELKHGVIALIEPGTPCLVFAPNDETLADVLSGAMELKSRGGRMIGVGPVDSDAFDVLIDTPDLPAAAPLVQALPAQLLGYHLALLRGHDPDRPRNLAKSVTVK